MMTFPHTHTRQENTTMQPTVYAADRHFSDDSYGGPAYINHCWRCDIIRHDDAPAML
jgi:hypothetical protein